MAGEAQETTAKLSKPSLLLLQAVGIGHLLELQQVAYEPDVVKVPWGHVSASAVHEVLEMMSSNAESITGNTY